MYCSTCGSRVPPGRRECETCGDTVAGRGSLVHGGESAVRAYSSALPVRAQQCPRCGYQGEGVSYFSRGSRVAALVGIAVVTMGAMGAGGVIYYFLRRDHVICPRCGKGWGHGGEKAVMLDGRGSSEIVPAPGRESRKNGMSLLLFLLAAIFLIGGVASAEVGVAAAGLLLAGGGVLFRQAANRERESRREALIASLQLPVLKLAARQGGRLTVTEVSAHLGWPIRRAEKILQSLDDGVRVDSDVTNEGVIVYEFRELLAPSPEPRNRLQEGGPR